MWARCRVARCGTVSRRRRPTREASPRDLNPAMGLMGEPRVGLLDEPTSALDQRGRLTMWELVRGLAVDGVTVVMTTRMWRKLTTSPTESRCWTTGDHCRRYPGGAEADDPRWTCQSAIV